MSPLQVLLLFVALLVPLGLVVGWWRTRRDRNAARTGRLEHVLRMEGGGRVMFSSDLDSSFIIDHPEAGALVLGSKGEPRRCLYTQLKAVSVLVNGTPVTAGVRSSGGVRIEGEAEPPGAFAIQHIVLAVTVDDPLQPEHAIRYFPTADFANDASLSASVGGAALQMLKAAQRDHAQLVERMRQAAPAPAAA